MDDIPKKDVEEGNKDKRSDPADIPLSTIFKGLTTAQFYGILLVLIGLFGGGYAVGQWASSTSHERELADKEDSHRQAILAKDEIITTRDGRITDLEAELETAKQTAGDALKVASAADSDARAFRAKAEFLNRYLSYLEDPSPSGTMRKLFADHVCVLWRETQRDVLSVDRNEITTQQVLRSTSLSPTALEALATAGIDRRMIDEYLQLNRRRSQIERRATVVKPTQPTLRDRFPRVDRSAETELRRLQNLEDRIGMALGNGISTKTVTFFDGSRYTIPQPVADDVHLRTDCQS